MPRLGGFVSSFGGIFNGGRDLSTALKMTKSGGAPAVEEPLPSLELRVYNRVFRGRSVILPTVTGLGTSNNLIGNFLWDGHVTEGVCPSLRTGGDNEFSGQTERVSLVSGSEKTCSPGCDGSYESLEKNCNWRRGCLL